MSVCDHPMCKMKQCRGRTVECRFYDRRRKLIFTEKLRTPVYEWCETTIGRYEVEGADLYSMSVERGVNYTSIRSPL